MFETIAHGIEFERRTEHQRVTPGWWVHHMAARTLLQILVTAIRAFLDEVRAELIEPLIADTSSDAALVTIQILDSLELVHKLTFHLRTAHQAVAVLGALRHAPTNDELWPDGSLPDDVPPALAEQLYLKLGQVALQLGHDSHDSTRPDLSGKATGSCSTRHSTRSLTAGPTSHASYSPSRSPWPTAPGRGCPAISPPSVSASRSSSAANRCWT